MPPPLCRPWALMAGAVLALASAAPANALTVDEARHLLTRTGFGAAPHEIRALLPLTRRQAVDRLIAGLDEEPPFAPPPAFLAQPIRGYRERLGDYVPTAMSLPAGPQPGQAQELDWTHRGMQEMAQLRAWWLGRMVSTPTPFAERLALFWHGHFTSKYFDVLGPRLLHDQLQAIRRYGTRDFGALLHAMLRDPAMLIFLDNAVSLKRAPNENLARETLELFTLGVGHYKEADIKALARILVGHSVDFAGDFRYRVRADELDTGPKRFLGRKGRLTLDDAEHLLLAHPRTAELLADKFWREFVSPEPDAAEVRRLAKLLRERRYALRPFLRDLLLAPAFWTPANRAQLVKSPVELYVGFVRSFDIALPDIGLLVDETALLGQELFEPPTVQGWKGNLAWLSPQALAARTERLASLWACRAAGLEAAQAGANDLLVRFSVEQAGAAATPRLRVLADGQEVGQATPRCAAQVVGAGQGIAKPSWDLLRLPRAALPADVRQIDVVFDAGSGPHANAFVNWIQLDGQRLPAYLGEVTFDAGQDCNAAQVPKGMMYCAGRLRFELPAIARRAGSEDPTLADRRLGPVNSIIESATARLPLPLRPAARSSQEQRNAVAAWDGLPLEQAVLPIEPLLLTPPANGLEARLAALLLDPAYQLK